MGELLVTRDGQTAVLTLSHPGKRNAVTLEMWRRLPLVLDDLARDPAVRVLVLTGAGEDFSAGSDISGLHEPDQPAAVDAAEAALSSFPKPAIAAITGYCIGGGCQLALACDLRVAADDARFGVPPANLGIVYPMAGVANLVRAVGAAQAKRLVFTAERIDAATAQRIGLVDELLPTAEVLPRALALAARIDTRSQLSIRAFKEMVRALDGDADPGAVEERWRAEAARGGDREEGQRAFAERREPRFAWTGPGLPEPSPPEAPA